jgi:hypothetical protein
MIMTLPLPKNCRLNEKERGVNFEVEIYGRTWSAFTTFEVLDILYLGADRIHAVSQSSYITAKVRERIQAGDDAEPILLSSILLPASCSE